MPRAELVTAGSSTARSGGSIYNRRIAESLRARGWTVALHELEGAYPEPDRAARQCAADTFSSLPDGVPTIVDGLVFSALPDVMAAAASRRPLVPVIHLPIADEIGLDPATVERFADRERRALASATRVVITGRATIDLLSRYAIPADRIRIVEPGTDRRPFARGSGSTEVHLLSVAALTPGKGHLTLLRALAPLADVPWRLTCVGSTTRHPATVDGLQAMLRDTRIAAKVCLDGEADRDALAAAYDAADVFVLATLRETYGMAVAEAVACGLPVIASSTGAIADLLGNGVGLLVPPGEVEPLTAALAQVLTDPGLRARLSDAARRKSPCLPTWDGAAAGLSRLLEEITTDG